MERKMVATTSSSRSFLARHEFLIHRLHSLTGLIPIGAYMTVHLATNASVLEGPRTYQRMVYQIHALGPLLPVVEWTFIFLPILFHGLFGLVIIRSGTSNAGAYPFPNNIRYLLQRVTGIIALVFIVLHVFHMHGWFHADAWLKGVVEPLGGGLFRPFNAASTLATAMQGAVLPTLYAVGVLSCVYHFANGLWTMGITWGVWLSPAAQRRATWGCAAVGVVLAILSMTALYGALTVDVPQAHAVEDAMYRSKVAAQEITPNEHKRSER
jgi:succinate dehydrogenase / fumarate reductase, cytochrome b subunit